MSDLTFNQKAHELLDLISDIDYGQVSFTPSYLSVEFSVWYAHGDNADQEAAANALLTRLFGTTFDLKRHTDIGHMQFLGDWNGIKVEIWTAQGAFCERVLVGTVIEPAQEAQPEREVEKYEWRCADPILAARS